MHAISRRVIIVAFFVACGASRGADTIPTLAFLDHEALEYAKRFELHNKVLTCNNRTFAFIGDWSGNAFLTELVNPRWRLVNNILRTESPKKRTKADIMNGVPEDTAHYYYNTDVVLQAEVYRRWESPSHQLYDKDASWGKWQDDLPRFAQNRQNAFIPGFPILHLTNEDGDWVHTNPSSFLRDYHSYMDEYFPGAKNYTAEYRLTCIQLPEKALY